MDEKSRKELQKRLTTALQEEPDSEFNRNCKMTVDFLDQVLSNYMVIGYDLNNVPFVICNNRTQKDADALKTLITKVMMGQDLNIKKI
jgi:hypothetical protein